MKLRQTLAMGAVSALVAPALAFTATSFAFADETQPSLTVTAPKVLGVGGKAVEFNAEIKGLGTGDEEESQWTRLYFTLDLASYFKDLTGKYRNHGIVLEYLDPHGDPGDWNEVEFSRDGSKLSGHVYSTFREDTTLKLRLSVAQPEPAPAATPAAPAPARRAAAGAADQAVKVLDDQAGTRTGVTRPGFRPCDTAVPGFTLTSELWPYYPELRLKAPSAAATSTPTPTPTPTEPEEQPLAKDTDKVKVGVPSVDLVDLQGDVVAGGPAKKFTAVLCNPTESAYDNVALSQFFGRLDEVTGADKDLSLEYLAKGKWSPVELKTVTEDDETFLSTSFVDADGKGVALAAGQKIPNELRITAAKTAKIGPWGSVGTVELLDSGRAGGFDRADFRVVAPGSTPSPSTSPTPVQPAPVPDDLAHTGGNLTVGLVGIGLLLGGAVAFLLVARRRRQSAA